MFFLSSKRFILASAEPLLVGAAFLVDLQVLVGENVSPQQEKLCHPCLQISANQRSGHGNTKMSRKISTVFILGYFDSLS